MLRNETHLRAAQREADNYPREVHADGRSWQFWSLSAYANRHRPVAWYTDGAQFMLLNVNGTPAEPNGHDTAHDASCWNRWRPKPESGQEAKCIYTQASIDYGFPAGTRPGLRMADEKLPALREGYPAGQRHPLFPEVPNSMALPAQVKARLLKEYAGMRVPKDPDMEWAEWDRKVRELGEHELRQRREGVAQ